MTAQQTLQQRVAELEAENQDLAQYSQDMKREVERLTIKLAEIFLHRNHLVDSSPYQYTVPYQIFFEQFPLPIAIYHTDGTMVAMNEQHKRRFQSAYNTLHGYSNVFADPQAIAGGHVESFRQATQGEVIKVAMSDSVSNQSHNRHTSGEHDVWSDVIYLPLYDQPGNVIFIIAMIVDKALAH